MLEAAEMRSRPNDTRNFVHKRIAGAVSGFVSGGFAGAVSGFVRSPGGGQRQRGTALQRTPGVVGVVQRLLPGGATGFREIETFGAGRIMPRQPDRSMIAIQERHQVVAAQLAEQTAAATGTQLCCPGGMHSNKSDYWVKERDGNGNFTGNWFFVGEGTRCVTNRRRNPLNPRALSRAMAREDSAVAIVDRLLPAPSRRASRKRKRKRGRRTRR